jgi:quercetin dioxygenase-like cupin family protein
MEMTDPIEDVARIIPVADAALPSEGITSRTIFKSPFVRIVFFGFSEGEELSEHSAPARVIIQILNGRCEFSVGSEQRNLAAGDIVYMPPNEPHSVKASEAFSMLLTMLTDPTTEVT